MLDLGALETLDRALLTSQRGALPPVACGDSPRDIFEQMKQPARPGACPFSARAAA
jgi:hypothetical protein